MSKSNKIRILWRPSKAELIFVIACISISGFLVSFLAIAYTPLCNLVPGYPTNEVKLRQMQTEMKLDSLERSIFRWEIYTENLRRSIEGRKPIPLDKLIQRAEVEFDERDKYELNSADSTLRDFVQEQEKFDISDKNKTAQIEGLHFFKPLVGTVSHHYQTAQHPYLDITAPEGSLVKSVLDGSVIYAAWNEGDNWSIAIQHQDGIISIYLHNRTLLKEVGDKVSAGTPIALLGASASIDESSPHLHFELWQDGSPLDPSLYINF